MNSNDDLFQEAGLSTEQAQIILDLAKQLPLIADISQADVFIDYLLPAKNAALVVAEANPTTAPSLYTSSVLGQIAFEENEPGVLFSLKTGKPVVGSKGISQENIVMQQDIVPIMDDSSGRVIGVLIKEKDISELFLKEKRVNDLMKSGSTKERQEALHSLFIQEVHHRVKNNLQVVSSLLRLQMRRASSEEVANIFRDSMTRISSMAMVHDYLARNGVDEVEIKNVFEQMGALLLSSMCQPELSIEYCIQGQFLYLKSDKASSLALVVNELIQNCIKHAFPLQKSGVIAGSIHCRKQMAHITIADNGCGFPALEMQSKKDSLGLQLVERLVKEELQGVISFFHSNRGTKVSITFPV